MFISWLDNVMSHPIAPFAFSVGICVFVLGFTSQKSPLRVLGVVPMLGCMQLVVRNVVTRNDATHQLYKSMLMGSTAGMQMQYLDSVLLSRWTFEAQGPTSALGGQTNIRTSDAAIQRQPKSRASTYLRRLIFGWEESFRSRSTRTPWEVNHVPAFLSDRPDMVPTKANFLYSTIRRFLISLLIVDMIGFMGRDATMNTVNFASDRIPLLSRLQDVTMEELLLRLISSTLHWVSVVALLQAIYDLSAIMVISIGLGRIERWPPLFNRWAECWSIRQFWGSFWHQATRQRFSAPANFVSFSILGLSKGTILARYVVLSLTFIVSGYYHQLGDIASGILWQEAGAARFFMMQAIGIMIEDTVQGIYRWLNAQKRTATGPTGWKRIIGVLWLLMWVTWTTPVWVYPMAQLSTGKSILPFSLLGYIYQAESQ